MPSKDLAFTYLAELRSIVRAAEQERGVPVWLAVLPPLAALVGAGVVLSTGEFRGGGFHAKAVGATATIATLLWLLSLLASLVVSYMLIDRRNSHFLRVQKLNSTIVGILDSLGVSDANTAKVKTAVEEEREREGARSALAWAIATALISIVWICVAYFLSKDLREHEAREARIYTHLGEVMRRAGVELPEYRPAVGRRPLALYAILTLLTLGAFMVYWLYTIARDLNSHLERHKAFEPKLLEAVEQLIERA